MCPGLTHKNVVEELAKNPVENNTPVAIMAEVPYVPPQALASPELLTSSLKRSRCPRMLTCPPPPPPVLSGHVSSFPPY